MGLLLKKNICLFKGRVREAERESLSRLLVHSSHGPVFWIWVCWKLGVGRSLSLVFWVGAGAPSSQAFRSTRAGSRWDMPCGRYCHHYGDFICTGPCVRWPVRSIICRHACSELASASLELVAHVGSRQCDNTKPSTTDLEGDTQKVLQVHG